MNLYVEELEAFDALFDWKEFCQGFSDGVAAACNVCTVGMT
jgi:hypothetical protein